MNTKVHSKICKCNECTHKLSLRTNTQEKIWLRVSLFCSSNDPPHSIYRVGFLDTVHRAVLLFTTLSLVVLLFMTLVLAVLLYTSRWHCSWHCSLAVVNLLFIYTVLFMHTVLFIYTILFIRPVFFFFLNVHF